MLIDWNNDFKVVEKILQDFFEVEFKMYLDCFFRMVKVDGKVIFNGDKSLFYGMIIILCVIMLLMLGLI